MSEFFLRRTVFRAAKIHKFLLPGLCCLFAYTSLADPPAKKAAPKSGPDTLLFLDGEKLIGHLERTTDKSVVFKSDMAGEVTVDWSKIKELHTAEPFAVVEKGTKLGWRTDVSNIPQGTLSANDKQVEVAAAPAPVTLPVANTTNIIDKPTFDKAIQQRPSIFADWKGTVTAGLAVVLSTQNSQTYTSAINLTRSLPTESWMEPANRTTLNFTSSYGELTQPNTPSVKTSIFHGDGERDEYFSSRLYAFGELAYDHDYSQGLSLEQTYGGGIGWTVIKTGNEEIDLKGEATFVNQQFFTASSNQKLFGSVFSVGWNRTFKHGIVIHEQLGLAPAWTNTNASSANGSINLTIPILKRIGFNIGAQDAYLEDPAPGYRKNSFQLTTGLTYKLP